MPDIVRYGVLSTARIARNQHIPAAAEAANARIVAIASRSRERAVRCAAELDIPKAYGSYDELLGDGDVDAVINALPNSLHCEWTVKAARAGKHVLCEKPLAVTIEQARQMLDAAETSRVLLMEGFTTRFVPQMPFVRETIGSGAIGEVRVVRAELTYTIQDWDGDSRARAELAGGCLLDAGCYCVNTIRYVMGAEPQSVQAFRRIREDRGVDSTFVGILRFPGDRMAFLATGMEQPFRACCEIIGTEGRIDVPGLFAGRTVVVTAGGEERKREFEPVNRFRLQIEHFSDCILTGRPPMLPPEDALDNTAALVALRRAAEQGRAVDVGA